jgi:hypothetical protein
VIKPRRARFSDLKKSARLAKVYAFFAGSKSSSLKIASGKSGTGFASFFVRQTHEISRWLPD